MILTLLEGLVSSGFSSKTERVKHRSHELVMSIIVIIFKFRLPQILGLLPQFWMYRLLYYPGVWSSFITKDSHHPALYPFKGWNKRRNTARLQQSALGKWILVHSSHWWLVYRNPYWRWHSIHPGGLLSSGLLEALFGGQSSIKVPEGSGHIPKNSSKLTYCCWFQKQVCTTQYSHYRSFNRVLVTLNMKGSIDIFVEQ